MAQEDEHWINSIIERNGDVCTLFHFLFARPTTSVITRSIIVPEDVIQYSGWKSTTRDDEEDGK